MIKLSQLKKDSLLYTFFNFFERGIPFLILPLITRIIEIEEVGYYILFQTIINILIPFLTLNIDSVTLINYYKLDKPEFKKYFSTGVNLFVTYFLFIFFIIFLLANVISNLISFEPDWLIFSAIIVFFQFFANLHKSLMRVEKKVFSFGLYSVSLVLIRNIISFILIIKFNFGWIGILYGHFISYFLGSLIAFYNFYKKDFLSANLNKNHIIDIFKTGAPISFHKLGLWLGSGYNKMIVVAIIGISAGAEYGIGATFAMLLTMLSTSINNALVPHVYELLKNGFEDDKKKIVSITFKIYGIFLFFAVIFVLVGNNYTTFIFGDKYIDSEYLVFPLVLAAFFRCLYTLHVNYIFYTKKTYRVTQITMISGVINCFLAYFLILYHGVFGAALSLLFINFIQYILAFYFSNKLIKMPWINFFIKD
jgi:O-antigen/teichoic acid export membrane protein